MGTELIVAIVGPILGGVISLGLFVNKKNAEFMSVEFERLHDSVTNIDKKIDDLRVDVAKNYVTNDELTNHIQSEDEWHRRWSSEMNEMRDEVTTTRVIVDRMWLDFQNQGKM